MSFKSTGLTPLPKLVASPVKRTALAKPKAPARPLPNMGLSPLPKIVASPKKSKILMKKKKKG